MRKHYFGLAGTLAAVLCVISCSTTTTSPDPQTKETTTMTSSCTGQGAYLIRMSIPYPDPHLPAPADGTIAPGFSVITMDAKASPALVSIVGHSPKFPNEEFNAKELGEEISYAGYTIRITSICDKEVLFDLVSQPG